jgi:hypothetical protein
MIRFIKQLYFTGFVLLFKLRPSQRVVTRAVRAVTGLALIEGLIFACIASWIDISIGRRYFLGDVNSLVSSKLIIAASFFALYFANYGVLVVRGHGIKFVNEFEDLKKGRRKFLIVSFWVVALFAILFSVGSRLAYRHFFHIES